ncbi:MAG TPA: DUF5946 family protein [Thermoleophilaceae bacterium]|nr:DUF5946 family protein [Thermoleophilaceae bacterium]
MATASACPGCGLELPERSGPVHDYIGASPACWALYSELLARQYQDYSQVEHRLTVDAYAVQHPGRPEPRAVQSVGVHLVALLLSVERRASPTEVMRAIRRLVATDPGFEWLDPPRPNGALTVVDVLRDEATPAEWAGDVWRAWEPHHPRVAAWLSRASPEGGP